MDLLVVQGTLKSLLQHHSSKALIFWCSAFFTVQLLHPYMTTGKTIDFTRRTFVAKSKLNKKSEKKEKRKKLQKMKTSIGPTGIIFGFFYLDLVKSVPK